MLADVDVNACLKKAEKILFMKRIVTICLMFLFVSLLRNDAIDFLMNTKDNSDIESSLDEDEHDLAMMPPMEKANTETYMDSATSNDMNDDLVHHLPGCLLNSTCSSSLHNKGNKQKSEQRTHPPNKKSRKSAAR